MPYVHLASPWEKQVCPNSAACWSPSAAEMRTPGRTRRARPYVSADGRISGSIWRGTPKMASSSSCQFRVVRSIRRVRLAFVTSVTCVPPSGPPVRFQISQLSMVPNSTSPRSARWRRPGVWSSSQRTFGAEKYVAGGKPQRLRTICPSAPRDSSSTRASVRVSCHTIARPAGRPVWRSHSTVVSRWLAMPSATTWSVVAPAWARASGAMRSRLCQISTGSCSTQPGLGKYCLCSRCVTAASRPPWSNRMHRVELVPWSTAIT